MPSIHSKLKSRAHSAQLAITKTTNGLIVEGIHSGDKFKVTMKINPDPRKPVEACVETRNKDNETDILQDVMLSLESAGIIALQSHQPQ